ncbi:hypothetical protein [Novosphingobium sp.]|uniref:hypothetical protein n=1 Tax=Novosphingobium sp. TaxID=1874826 RepID=UPI00286A29E5|nr:hypothetical protein [Novosphingobium sp.]
MSRAMNIRLPQAEVVAACAAAKVAISAIEVLPSGGTHLVCLNIEGADEMRHKLKKHLIEGRVKRFPFLIANKY